MTINKNSLNIDDETGVAENFCKIDLIEFHTESNHHGHAFIFCFLYYQFNF